MTEQTAPCERYVPHPNARAAVDEICARCGAYRDDHR